MTDTCHGSGHRADRPPDRRLRSELRWFTSVVVPVIVALHVAMSLNPVVIGGLVTRIGLLVAALAS